VLPQTSGSGTTTRVPVDIRRFPWIKRLAADYAFDFARVADFFAGNPSEPSAWRDAIVRTQQHTRARDAVTDLVQAQQRRRGAPPDAIAAAARLRDSRTIAIVTGQQAGLFGGPLFTLLKALTAIRLADRVAAEHHVPAVPVFWIDSEDHDWDEVKSCGVLDSELSLVDVTLGSLPGAGEGPVANVRLGASIDEAIATLQSILQPTEFTPALLEAVHKAYRPGQGMADAFGRWLEGILGPRGLIVFDSADPAAKPLAAPLFAREVEQAGATSRLAAAAGAGLVARGYHAQVTPHDDHLARTAMTVGHPLLERVHARPAEFSPSVLLRPIVQDTLFPTACYVAGPNELAYLAQLRQIYEAFGVPMPLMYQRTSATILDSGAMRFLTRHPLTLDALRARDEGGLNQVLETHIPPAVHASLDEAARAITERMETLARTVAALDPTLEGAVQSTRGRVQDDLKKLHGKIIQAIKRKDETLRRQFRHAQAQAFPGGHPQERAVGFIYFLNKYGFSGLVDRLSDDLPLEQGTHWAVAI